MGQFPNKPCNCGSGKRVGLCENPPCRERAGRIATYREAQARGSRYGRVLVRVEQDYKKGEPGEKPTPEGPRRLRVLVDKRRGPITPMDLRLRKPRPTGRGT